MEKVYGQTSLDELEQLKTELSLMRLHQDLIDRVLKIPNNATNGDVIKALFLKEEIEEFDDTFGIIFERTERFTICEATFDKNWWNAQYKGENNAK